MADNNGTPLPAGAPYDRGEQLKMWLGDEAELPLGAPYDRDEQLKMWLGDEAELPPGAPYDRDEQLTMWLKDHIGGGGNPNYVETVTGTLANPWGNVDPSALHQSVLARDASVEMDIDATALGMGHIYLAMSQFVSAGIAFTAVSGAGLAVDRWTVFAIAYTVNGAIDPALLLQDGTVTVMNEYASVAPTTLTIIHHPLPDTP